MSSTTYAIFFRVNTFENTESYTAGVLDIQVEEGSTLSLTNTLPITDSEGASLTPYTFTVKNVGNLTYTFDLKMLSTTSSNPINSSYIKVKLDNNEPVLLSSLTNGIIGSDITLNPGESITMSIRIWLDINTPNTEIGKSFSAKIVTDGVGSEYVEPSTGADYITSLVSSNPDTMNNDDPDNNVRYMGADPNNYVLFNNELWRIIGVFDVASTYGGPTEKRLKIIRNESIDNIAWDSGNVNDWTQASLQEYLNGEYYNSIESISQSLIGDAVWNLGGTASYSSASTGLPSHFYGYERGTTVYSGRPTYWVGKIGLMYPSDYGYATSGGTTTNRESCLAKEMYNWKDSSYSDCNNHYLYDASSSQWTITPHSSNSRYVFNVLTPGYVKVDLARYTFSASPVLYLKSTVEITGGEGSQSKPYTLQMPPMSAADYITSLLSSNPTTMNNDDPDGNVRYMGADPNNYVRFNNELWRIIGVFDVASTYGGPTEKRLKIIRDEPIGTYSWDNKPSGTGSSTSSYGSNDWTDSALMEVLNNGAYWNRTSGTCPSGSNGATTSCDFSSIGLTEEAKALIGDAVWNLGGTASFTSASNGLPSHFYGYERGTTVYGTRPTYWVGKIGLMYPSDYGYATSGGTTTDRSSCLAKEMYNWDSSSYSDCKNNDYLYNSSYRWTITPLSSYSYGVFYVNTTGYVDGNDANYSNNSVSPVLYLKSTVQITGGEGTSENPFTLS